MDHGLSAYQSWVFMHWDIVIIMPCFSENCIAVGVQVVQYKFVIQSISVSMLCIAIIIVEGTVYVSVKHLMISYFLHIFKVEYWGQASGWNWYRVVQLPCTYSVGPGIVTICCVHAESMQSGAN